MSHICFDRKSLWKSLSFVRINDFEEVLSGNCDDIPEVTRGLEVLSFDTFRQNLLGYILCAYYTHKNLYTYIQTYYICSWRCFLLIGEICQIEVMRRLKSATGLKSWDSWRLQEKTSRFSFFCSYLSCCFPDSMTGIWLRCIWIWQAAFYMIGGMSDVKEKAAKLAAVAAGKWRGVGSVGWRNHLVSHWEPKGHYSLIGDLENR